MFPERFESTGRTVGAYWSGFAHLSSGDNEFLVAAGGSLRDDNLLKASRAFELPTAVAGIGRDVLAANRTRKLKLAHLVGVQPFHRLQ